MLHNKPSFLIARYLNFSQASAELEINSLVVSIKEIGNLLSIKTPTIDKILYEVEKKISKNN